MDRLPNANQCGKRPIVAGNALRSPRQWRCGFAATFLARVLGVVCGVSLVLGSLDMLHAQDEANRPQPAQPSEQADQNVGENLADDVSQADAPDQAKGENQERGQHEDKNPDEAHKEKAPEGPIPPGTYDPAVVIHFEGEIRASSQTYLFRRLDTAKSRGAKLVILQIDSPGGEIGATLEIGHRLLELDWAKTVAYVPREALSGAAIIALACDEIILAPSARFGDAGPIVMDQFFMFRHAEEKILSHLATEVRHFAEETGRPPALAEAMVDRNLEVLVVRNTKTGEETCMSEAELAAVPQPDDWEKLQPVFESRKDHFLEVTGKRAVEIHLANGLADNLDQLKQRYGIEQDPLELRHTWVDSMVTILNFPLITVALLVVGLICFYVEVASPGLGLGGLLGTVCFGVFFWSKFLGGTAGWLEVTLFVLGILCLGIELFLLPGFGFSGVTGLLLILGSLVLAGQTFILPETGSQLQTLTGSLGMVVVSGIVFMMVATLLSRRMGSLPLMSRIMLAPPDAAAIAVDAPTEGSTGALMEGRRGVAHSALRPFGKARFGDDFVEVMADGEFINEGTPIEVIGTQGHRIIVREV
jgi:membrane-bound serine protease (ClpP class)